MQSVQENEILEGLQNNVNKAKLKLRDGWKINQVQQAKLVIEAAEAMEQLYVQSGNHEFIKNICQDLRHFLEQCGLDNPHHVNDYLHNYPKYKREYEKEDSSSGKGEPHLIDGNNLLVLKDKINGNISQVTKEEAQTFHEIFLKLKSAAETNKQWCEINGWALSDDDPLKKRYAKVSTDMPEPKETDAYYAFKDDIMPIVNTWQKTHEEICTKLFKLPPEERDIPEMVEAIKEYATIIQGMVGEINEFLAPLKDLKFAMAKPRWWKTILKYAEHGKHAAAVMDPILSHKYLEDRLIDVLKINCPHQGCEYFATVSESTVTAMDAPAREQVKLLIDHMIDNHPRETRYLPIAVQRTKIAVQVPSERDLTREEVGDKIKEHVLHAIRFADAVKMFCTFPKWREKTASGRVATRRQDAHEKLQDLA